MRGSNQIGACAGKEENMGEQTMKIADWEKVGRDLQKALDKVKLPGLNAKLNVGGFRYGDTACTFQVECALVADDGTVQTAGVTAFRECAKDYGLKPGDLGKTITYNGKKYKITGLKPSSRRFPIETVQANGQTTCFTTDLVLKLLGRKAA
jgi:hypothetical protein